ncbi:MAG TPA: tRNA methyl transferase PRC-barrel domain-containing protein, partial [Candidatus Limnocylindrales bacterium]|nr:tRNA methyl transferase PRC-barrel domain-containing protein [Candidatus Limnocylindrales bacterium]
GRARHLYDCEAVATGHYARRTVGPDGSVRLRRAVDENKDQTYFLYGLRQDQLADARFPLGDLTKPEVRAIARRLGLATADKAESQGICFIPDRDLRGALRTRAGWEPEPGPIVDARGERVGEHAGAAGYTVGQRQGLGLALGEPRYVSRVDPRTNTITLARREDLETTSIVIEDLRLVAGPTPAGPFHAEARFRHRGALVRSTVSPLEDARWLVRTEAPVWAAAPGQAAVLYDGDRCLGGGRIVAASETRPTASTSPEPVVAGAAA